MSLRWAFHNIVGHPIMGLLHLCGAHTLAMRVHDATLPGGKATTASTKEAP
jgi:hypothetical protein